MKYNKFIMILFWLVLLWERCNLIGSLCVSAQSAGPLLSLHRFLHAGPPGRQVAPPTGSEVSPEVLLYGQRPQRSHDARTLLLRHRQRPLRRHQEDWGGAAEKAQTDPGAAPQPVGSELQKQL